MSDYTDHAHDREADEPTAGRSRPSAGAYLLIGLVLGLVLGFVAAWLLGGNPLSDANRVVYTDVVVGSVTESADQICWAEDPERRDSPQTCAILALDPEIEVPEEGDVVTLGIVELRTPDGAEFTQVVYVGPADASDVEADLDEATDPAVSPDDDPTATPTP